MDKSRAPTHCPLMWHGLSDRDGESLYPCCRFDYFDQPGVPASKEEPLVSSLNSKEFSEWRSKMREGKQISSCYKCHEDEKIHVKSERECALEEIGPNLPSTDTVELSKIQNAEAFVGNQCNLRCHSCNPASSSGWASEYQRLGWQWHTIQQNTLIADSISEFTGLRILKVIGGEPAFSKKFEELILNTPHPEKVELHISSNATRVFTDNVLAKLQKFQKVRLSLSIDGYADLNEMIRYPSKWNDIEATAKLYLELSKTQKNLQLILHTTVSILNVFELLPLINWWNALRNNSPRSKAHLSILRSPSFLSIQNLTKNEQQRALQLLNENSDPLLDGIKRELNGPPAQNPARSELVDYCEKIDQSRGTKFFLRFKKYIDN